MAKTNNADDGKHVARSSDAAEEGSESGDTQRSFMDTMYNAAYYAVLFFVVQNLMTSTIAWVGQNKHDRAARDGGEAPASPMSPRSQASPQRSALQPGSLLNTFLPGDTYSVLVYLSDIDEGEFDPVRHGDKALVWSASDLSYGDWDSGIRHTLVNVSVEDHPQLRRNGSLFIHAYAVKRGGTLLKSHPDYNDRDVAELHANIVRFKQRKVSKGTRRLLGSNEPDNTDVPGTKSEAETAAESAMPSQSNDRVVVAHWHGNLSLQLLTEESPYPYQHMLPEINSLIKSVMNSLCVFKCLCACVSVCLCL